MRSERRSRICSIIGKLIAKFIVLPIRYKNFLVSLMNKGGIYIALSGLLGGLTIFGIMYLVSNLFLSFPFLFKLLFNLIVLGIALVVIIFIGLMFVFFLSSWGDK